MGFSDHDQHEAFESYRALSKSAVAGLILAMLGLLGWLFPVMLAFAILAVLLGMLALANIRRYPEELAGRWPARIAVNLGLLTVVGGVSYHSYVYATEVPEGYERISFAMLQPDPKHPLKPIPPAAKTLNEKRIFVKGYIHPSVAGMGPVRRFVLVPDMGTCCFGGQPKLTKMIEVTLTGALAAQYSTSRRKLAGTLKVDDRLKPVSGLKGVYYQLECDYIK